MAALARLTRTIGIGLLQTISPFKAPPILAPRLHAASPTAQSASVRHGIVDDSSTQKSESENTHSSPPLASPPQVTMAVRQESAELSPEDVLELLQRNRKLEAANHKQKVEIKALSQRSKKAEEAYKRRDNRVNIVTQEKKELEGEVEKLSQRIKALEGCEGNARWLAERNVELEKSQAGEPDPLLVKYKELQKKNAILLEEKKNALKRFSVGHLGCVLEKREMDAKIASLESELLVEKANHAGTKDVLKFVEKNGIKAMKAMNVRLIKEKREAVCAKNQAIEALNHGEGFKARAIKMNVDYQMAIRALNDDVQELKATNKALRDGDIPADKEKEMIQACDELQKEHPLRMQEKEKQHAKEIESLNKQIDQYRAAEPWDRSTMKADMKAAVQTPKRCKCTRQNGSPESQSYDSGYDEEL